MKNNFNDCLDRLLKDEGGYTNNTNDSGGPTNFGITLKDYQLYINKQGTAKDVKEMAVDEARQIYRTKYWDALSCDSLPNGVDYTCFDYGVNSGLGRPRKALQRFKSKVGADLINAINNERVTFLKALEASQPKDKVFDAGWMKRVSGVRSYSLQLAKNNTTGPVTGSIAAGATVGLSQYFHAHEAAILIGGLALAILIGTGVHTYLNRKNNG